MQCNLQNSSPLIYRCCRLRSVSLLLSSPLLKLASLSARLLLRLLLQLLMLGSLRLPYCGLGYRLPLSRGYMRR